MAPTSVKIKFVPVREYPFKVRKKKGATVIAGLHRFHAIKELE